MQIFLVTATFPVALCEDSSCLVIAVYSIPPPPFTKLPRFLFLGEEFPSYCISELVLCFSAL
jgi:hypothetical protein